MQRRRLPSVDGDAVRMLAEEVNRLNGQVAALIAYIQAKEAGKPIDRSSLLKEATETHPGNIVPPIGPTVLADHADITLAYILNAD